MRTPTFSDVLPRLVSAYAVGKLVPFIGAGMSSKACPCWEEMVTGLETHAQKIGAPVDGNELSKQLLQRASHIGTILRRKGNQHLIAALRDVIYKGAAEVPDQTRALAAIDWPLILTTNYDDLLKVALERRFDDESRTLQRESSMNHVPDIRQVTVLGRGVRDCQQVSSSLDAPTGPLLWALQGFLSRSGAHALEEEIVLGHEEYRRATHTQLHFRRVFAEVFRRRSFLFLGSGLGEPYFLDLFGEVIEFFGPNSAPHYALTSDDVDVEFLRSRYNIIVVKFNAYGELIPLLDELGRAIRANVPRPAMWSYSLRPLRAATSAKAEVPLRADLSIINDRLPEPDREQGECVVLSAGLTRDGGMYLSGGMQSVLRNVDPGVRADVTLPRSPGDPSFFDLAATNRPELANFAAVAPWFAWDQRDLRLIRPATIRALEWAAARDFRVLRMPLIGAGLSRHFHPRFSLIEIIQGFRDWRRNPENEGPLELIIHVVDADVVRELTSGSINPLELLASTDLRFWLEVVDGERFERELLFRAETEALSSLAARYGVDSAEWAIEVEPRPQGAAGEMVGPRTQDMTLRQVGVLPGSTLRFLRNAIR